MAEETWATVASKLPTDIPDTAYDALRLQYFDSRVRPEVMRTGGDPELTRIEFFKQTERTNKSSTPKIDVALTSAAKHLAGPILGLVRGQNIVDVPAQEAVTEAERQGESTFLPEMAGAALGELPYWVPAMRVARTAAKAMQVSNMSAEVLGGGLIQGSLDGIRAKEGNRVDDAVSGFVLGAGIAGLGEGIASSLSRVGYSKEAAKQIEKVAKNPAKTTEEAVKTALAVNTDPAISTYLESWLKSATKTARELGSPSDSLYINDSGNVIVKLKSPLGKRFVVGGGKGFSEEQIPEVASTIADFLKKGGEVELAEGDPDWIRLLYRHFEDIADSEGYFDPRIFVGGKSTVDAPTVRSSVERSSIPAPATKAPAELAAGDGGGDRRISPSIDIVNVALNKIRNSEQVSISDLSETLGVSKREAMVALTEARTLAHRGQSDPVRATITSYMAPKLVGGETKNIPQTAFTGDVVGGYFDSIRGSGTFNFSEDATYMRVTTDAGSIQVPIEGINPNSIRTGLNKVFSTNNFFKSYDKMPLPSHTLRRVGDATVDGDGNIISISEALQKKIAAKTATESSAIPPQLIKTEEGTPPASITHVKGEQLEVPVIMAPESTPRNEIFHEELHSHFGELGLGDAVNEIGGSIRSVKLLSGVLEGTYPEHTMEEAVTRLLEFSEASGGKESGEFIKYIAEKTKKKTGDVTLRVSEDITNLSKGLLEKVNELPDSHSKRLLEEKLGKVHRSASKDVTAIKALLDKNNASINFSDNTWYVKTKEGSIFKYDNLTDLLGDSNVKFKLPVTIPSLVDESAIPEGVPRLGTIGSFTADRVKLSRFAPSYFFRPKLAWAADLSSAAKLPELYDSMKSLDDAYSHTLSSISNKHAMIKSTGLTQLSPDRREALGMYYLALDSDKAKLMKELNITPEEKHVVDLVDNLVEGIREGNKPSPKIMSYYLNKTAGRPSELMKEAGLSASEQRQWKEFRKSGAFRENEADLLRIVDTWVQGTVRRDSMTKATNSLKKVIDTKDANGVYKLPPTIRDLLERHISHIEGIPDQSQTVVDGVVASVIDMIGSVTDKVNKVLPDSAQIPRIKSAPRDIMGKWLLHMYAGTMGGKLMVPLRDSLQMFVTDYALLGNRLFGGMSDVFSDTWRNSGKGAIWERAEAAGALISDKEIMNLYTGSFEHMQHGLAEKFSHKLLQPMQWSNNSNRLVAFQTYSDVAKEAMMKNIPTGNIKGFIKESKLFFLDKPMQDQFVNEVFRSSKDGWDTIADKIAAQMVNTTQWGYRKTIQPGLYQYSLGRLFGQYGTWPLNYIEFARRLARSGDISDRMQNLSRLLVSHYSILSIGASMGIDTGSWVFHNPAVWSGGPLLSTAQNVPRSADTETFQGDTARRELSRIGLMSIPMGVWGKRVFESIQKDDPNLPLVFLGFTPLKRGSLSEDKGLQKIVP